MVQKIKLHGEKLELLVLSFMEAIIILNHKWFGKEMPPLHRLFPCDVIAMFRLWYEASQDSKVRIVLDEEKFIEYFERLLTQKKIKYEQVVSKSSYCLSQGAYKYKFSSLRLTKRGFELYLNLLSDYIKPN
jgi:hypothetical protein